MDDDTVPIEEFDNIVDTPIKGHAYTECIRSFETLASMRRHRTKIHGPSGDTADAKPKSVGARKTNIERELVQWFTFIGMTVSMFNSYDGMVVVQRAEQLGHAWANLCRQNKSIEKVVLGLLQTSAIGEVIMATSTVVIPIAANHDVIPKEFANLFGAQIPQDDGLNG